MTCRIAHAGTIGSSVERNGDYGAGVRCTGSVAGAGHRFMSGAIGSMQTTQHFVGAVGVSGLVAGTFADGLSLSSATQS